METSRTKVLLAAALFFVAGLASAQSRFVSTVAGVPGVAGARDGFAREATFERPTWIDVVTGASPVGGAKDGNIFWVERANRALRKISDGRVATSTVFDFVRQPLSFDFGGPFGGGIL